LLLRDGDDRVRLAAVTSLGRVAGGQSTDAIVHAVNTDDNLDVRIAAVHALGRTQSPRAAEVLVDLLDGPRGEVALEAKLVLGSMGAHATAELRACLLGQPSRARADACVHALARTGDGDAALAIADAWRRRVCSADAALESFGVLGDARVLPAVLESLGDADPWVRRRAIVALFVLLDPEVPDGRAVEPLLAAAQGAAQRPDELLLLVDLLGRTGASRIAPELLTYARSPRPRLRVAALQALGMVRAQGAERVLLHALDGAEPAERRAAALALYRAGSKDAVPSLLRKLDASSGEDVEWVLLALRGTVSRSGDPDIGAELERRLASATGPRRDALLEVLVVSRGAASALERVARRGGARSRAKVAELVAALPEARPLALELARDRGAVRENALWSLGFIGSTSDLDLLAGAIGDAAPRAAANAAVSFGRLARKDSDPAPLCQALDRGAAAVRTSVLTALRLSGLGCRGRERALLLDRSRFVRLAAAELLAQRRSDAEIAGLLARCADEDRDARVAEACRSEPAQALPSGPAVTTFVWSAGGTEPVPGLSYALRLADGSVRHGLADRRGAVHESKPAKGELSLEVPLLDAAD
jgi:HEAT repeat protein